MRISWLKSNTIELLFSNYRNSKSQYKPQLHITYHISCDFTFSVISLYGKPFTASSIKQVQKNDYINSKPYNKISIQSLNKIFYDSIKLLHFKIFYNLNIIWNRLDSNLWINKTQTNNLTTFIQLWIILTLHFKITGLYIGYKTVV